MLGGPLMITWYARAVFQTASPRHRWACSIGIVSGVLALATFVAAAAAAMSSGR
jgi:hypothetical protein